MAVREGVWGAHNGHDLDEQDALHSGMDVFGIHGLCSRVGEWGDGL